ncbi:MAG: hypothetical protein IPN60_02700 [Saprospiraceae bacterium]|nr:hypothetical protein [Candidatus Opimibacter skivensis]
MKRCIALAMGMLLVMAADAQMSIIRPATPAGEWTTDFDMAQTPGDSAVWTLSIYLSDGLVKCRKNHDPMLTWGDVTFPTGTGILGGSDIPADPGFYLVSFDTSTLAYSFHRDLSVSTIRHLMLPWTLLVRLHSGQRILMSQVTPPRCRLMSV